MLTQMKRRAAMIAACILGLYLLPAFANEYSVSPGARAYGQFDALLVCGKTAEGMKVTLLDKASRARMLDTFGIDVELGDPCLASLVLFPLSFRVPPPYAKFPPGGTTTTAPEYLVWTFDNTKVSETASPGFGDRRKSMLFCDADGNGGLTTASVVGADYTHQEGESCGVTRAALMTDGTHTTGPISAKLGGSNGGLLFVGQGPAAVVVLECNMNTEGELVATYLETQNGVDTNALGKSCLDVQVVREAVNDGLRFNNPIPIPQYEGVGNIHVMLPWKVKADIQTQ